MNPQLLTLIYIVAAAFSAWLYGMTLSPVQLASGAAVGFVVSLGAVSLPNQVSFMGTFMPVLQVMNVPASRRFMCTPPQASIVMAETRVLKGGRWHLLMSPLGIVQVRVSSPRVARENRAGRPRSARTIGGICRASSAGPGAAKSR